MLSAVCCHILYLIYLAIQKYILQPLAGESPFILVIERYTHIHIYIDFYIFFQEAYLNYNHQKTSHLTLTLTPP